MATQNAIDSGLPIQVSDGGTGNASLTDHGVLVGSGSSAITPLAVGATGTLLVGSTGGDPALATSADGNFAFTSSTAAQTRILTVSNTDNTNSSSNARVDISVGGANTFDPTIRYTIIASDSWMVGVDNSDSDKFKIADHNVDIGTNTRWISTTAGEITKPVQPAFGVVAADQANVTGDGTVYVVTFTAAEYFDQSSDFDGTSTFTASVTGKYQFNITIAYADISTQNIMQVRLQTSNRNYIPNLFSPSAIKDSSNQLSGTANFLVDMDAADIAQVGAFITGGAKTVDILGASTFFNGLLVC